jgi:hypothetical protein
MTTEDQDHIEEVLNAGVASTTMDGQSTTFVSPAELRKRARDLDEAAAAAVVGTRVKRPMISRLRIWG